MTLLELETLSDVIANLVTAMGLLVGGGWVLWKFGIHREAHAKIEFDLELEVLGRQADSLIVEVVAKVTNRGLVRHELEDFRFDLLYLPTDSPVEVGDDRINKQVLFEPVFKRRYWLPPDWLGSFIDPGVSQRFTYVASAPKDTAFLLVFAVFKYPDAESEFHTAQRVWAVGEKTPVPAANPALHPGAPLAARR